MIDGHLTNLLGSDTQGVRSTSKWYNTIDNLMLSLDSRMWPRGHPYSRETRKGRYMVSNEVSESVLNMGLWAGDPDLDALTLLQLGSMDGKSPVKSTRLKFKRILVGKGDYFAVCSMNTSFRIEILPSFYQLYMKQFGIDRFDDIWSGIFLKKIADQLGDYISLGAPIGFHDKRPRDLFRDVRAELEGIIINVTLWKIVDTIELDGKDYYECYTSLAEGLNAQLDQFSNKLHRDFILLQIDKMRLWLDMIDRLIIISSISEHHVA